MHVEKGYFLAQFTQFNSAARKLFDSWLLYFRCWTNLKWVTLIYLVFQVFREVAYKARTRQDILTGIDEFLDQVTVLPPGEWDPKIRIEPPTSVPSQVLTCMKFCNRFNQIKRIAYFTRTTGEKSIITSLVYFRWKI